MPGARRYRFWPGLRRLRKFSSARWLVPAALFLLSFGLHYHTLWGDFVWDDRPAVVGNHDVWTDSPWGDMWRHDFWGQQMAHAESHKSFRPLTTLTYRLNNFAAQKLSEYGKDNTSAAGGQPPDDYHTNTTETAEVVTENVYFARGAGPEHADAVGFHLFNVIVHAATCSSSVWLFRAIFAGEELPASVASLLFTVHPVHIEAVAPMVGRADLLCGLLSVIALILTITWTEKDKDYPRGQETKRTKELEVPLHPSNSVPSLERGRSSNSRCRRRSSSGSSSRSSSSSKGRSDITSTSSGTSISPINSTRIMSAEEDRTNPTLSSGKYEVEEVEGNTSRPKTRFEYTTEQPRQRRDVIKAPAFQDSSCLAAQGIGSSSSLSTAGLTKSWFAAEGEATTASVAEEAPVRLTSSTESMAVDDDSSEGTINDRDARNESGGVATFPKSCRAYSVATVRERLLLPTAIAAVATACGDGTNSSPAAGTDSGDREDPVAAPTSGDANETDHEDEGEGGQDVGRKEQEQEGRQQQEEHGSLLDPSDQLRFDRPTMCSSAAPGTAASCCFSSDEEDKEDEARAGDEHGENDPAIEHSTIHDGGGVFSSNVGAGKVEDVKISGPGMARYSTALFLATGATLCKEVGITVFALIAGGEIVRLFDKRARRRQQQQGSDSSAAGVLVGWWQRVRQRMTTGALAGAVARVVSAAACACSLVFLHVRLHEGAGVREWGVLENDISILLSRKERALSYAFTHTVYASKLVWPAKLCYDWGFSCIPHVTSWVDPANLASLALYASILATAAVAVVRCDTAVMWGLALVAVPFLPASNILFPVGAVVAERLLYLPSLGACILAGCMLRSRGGDRGHGIAASSSSSSSAREHVPAIEREVSEHDKMPDLKQGSGPPASVKGKKKEQNNRDNNRHPPFLHARSAVGTFLRPPRGDNRKNSTSPPGQPSISYSSLPSTATARSPRCTRSGALLADNKECQKGITEPQTRLSDIVSPRQSARRNTVAVLLLSWAAFFGARTVRRCEDWKSERSLFESALEVCPDGIKTLNNLGVGMLNEEEAGRAKVLLRRAVKLHPGFGFAFFNLGVSLMIRRDHVGAASALERSLELEPWNTKVMVYLGQVYLELTLKALESRPDEAQEGDGVNSGSEGTRHRSVGDGSCNDEVHAAHIRSLSPESLLLSAEAYTDRALDTGTGLPLARLVKGQALSLRGQHQEAATFYQDSIERSLYLLSRRSGTISISAAGSKNSKIIVGSAAGSLEASDAVDLAGTYNRLGLALRDSGSNDNAAKEAFLAGLSVAPDDLPLLVNGGVIHQNTGDIPGAKALYHRALSLQPNSPELLNNVGWLEEQSGGGSRLSLETAAELYGSALVLLPEESLALKQIEINLKNVRRRLLLMDA